jgi:hypothetical protein
MLNIANSVAEPEPHHNFTPDDDDAAPKYAIHRLPT